MNIRESRGCWERGVSVLCGGGIRCGESRTQGSAPSHSGDRTLSADKERLVAPTTHMHSPKYVRSAMQAVTSTAAKNESFPADQVRKPRA